jgi:hypothetical protein
MSDVDRYEIDDPNFVQDLKDSCKHVAKVAEWLRSTGKSVKVNPIHIRDNVRNMSQFADGGDIEVDGKRVEVKQRRVRFFSRESFPYETIIVDAAHIWDKADPKPVAYILTNEEVTGCLIVKADTFEHWTRLEKWDRFKNRNRFFYECPIEHTVFRRIEIPKTVNEDEVPVEDKSEPKEAPDADSGQGLLFGKDFDKEEPNRW